MTTPIHLLHHHMTEYPGLPQQFWLDLICSKSRFIKKNIRNRKHVVKGLMANSPLSVWSPVPVLWDGDSTKMSKPQRPWQKATTIWNNAWSSFSHSATYHILWIQVVVRTHNSLVMVLPPHKDITPVSQVIRHHRQTIPDKNKSTVFKSQFTLYHGGCRLKGYNPTPPPLPPYSITGFGMLWPNSLVHQAQAPVLSAAECLNAGHNTCIHEQGT